MKHVTPSLYKKVRNYYSMQKTPRPSTIFMNRYFDNKLLVGAEIGVDEGKNALSLFEMLNIEKLYLVDVYDNLFPYTKAIKRLELYRKNIQFIIKKSIDASRDIKEPLDFVYIDANHSYIYVYQDIELWYKKVKRNGILCGHDIYNYKDVFKAVKDYCIMNQIKFYIIKPDWYIIKN